MGSAPDHIANRHLMSAALAVDAHLSGPTHHAQADVLTWSENDRTHGQREWAHGHQQEVFQRRLQDRAAAGKGVRRRPAGGRHDGAVRVDDAHSLSAHVDLEAQDPRLTRVVHHNLVQADLLHQVLALPRESDLQHGPFLDSVGMIEESAQANLHAFRFDLGQKSEVPVVDAQDRGITRSRQTGSGQKSSIAAQREDEVGALQEIVGLLHLGVALELDGVDVPCLHRAKDIVDLVVLHSRTSNEADLHAFTGCRWTKISRLPSAPARSDGASPVTSYPLAAHHSLKRKSADSTAASSRTIPPFPTCERPTSNCGLNRATTSACAAARRTPGSTFSRLINDTSATTRLTGSGNDSRSRALVRSMTMTRGSCRSRQCRRPRPTSSANTFSAPRRNRTTARPITAPTKTSKGVCPRSSRSRASCTPRMWKRSSTRRLSTSAWRPAARRRPAASYMTTNVKIRAIAKAAELSPEYLPTAVVRPITIALWLLGMPPVSARTRRLIRRWRTDVRITLAAWAIVQATSGASRNFNSSVT